jgi:hypothetical protein
MIRQFLDACRAGNTERMDRCMLRIPKDKLLKALKEPQRSSASTSGISGFTIWNEIALVRRTQVSALKHLLKALRRATVDEDDFRMELFHILRTKAGKSNTVPFTWIMLNSDLCCQMLVDALLPPTQSELLDVQVRDPRVVERVLTILQEPSGNDGSMGITFLRINTRLWQWFASYRHYVFDLRYMDWKTTMFQNKKDPLLCASIRQWNQREWRLRLAQVQRLHSQVVSS